ncbi:hypothetical protein HMN09_00802100 [Mycena chlorophos]|uniref:Uncharacterized protein n=1 Tax=Mycena chlorophos TaxID=658473 RepID=A0A8H6W8F8_MYCCL|nr:hypothetical protein HMN09_00802100 [Mycena chlorophos]
MAAPTTPVHIRDFAYPTSDPRHVGMYQPVASECQTAPTMRPSSPTEPDPSTTTPPMPVATPPKRRVRTLAEVHSYTLMNSRKRLRVEQERISSTSASWAQKSSCRMTPASGAMGRRCLTCRTLRARLHPQIAHQSPIEYWNRAERCRAPSETILRWNGLGWKLSWMRASDAVLQPQVVQKCA